MRMARVPESLMAHLRAMGDVDRENRVIPELNVLHGDYIMSLPAVKALGQQDIDDVPAELVGTIDEAHLKALEASVRTKLPTLSDEGVTMLIAWLTNRV